MCVFSASDCRMKWHNLRSSYSRYLRDIKKQPSGSGCNKKKKWYLADAMSFLNNYVSQHKPMASNMNCVEDEESEVLPGDKETNEDSNPCTSESRSSSGSFKPSSSSKHWKHSPAEVLAAPMAKFLQSVSEPRVKEQESPLVNFFRGVLPDIEKLAPKRQRMFKAELVKLVNKLVDEEEEENARVSSRPSSTYSAMAYSPPSHITTIQEYEGHSSTHYTTLQPNSHFQQESNINWMK